MGLANPTVYQRHVPLTTSRESNKSMKYQWYDWSQQTIVINFKFAELVPNQGLLFKKGRDNKYDKKASNWCSAWCSKQSGGGPDTWWHSLRLGFYLLPRKCFYLHMLACDITQPRYQIRMACATPEKKKKKKYSRKAQLAFLSSTVNQDGISTARYHSN